VLPSQTGPRMRFTIRDLLWLTVLVAIVLVAFVVRSRREGRWEYRITADADTSELNKDGDQRWELVALKPSPGGGAQFYFKRPK
jgi:hypothetical protein